MSENHLTGNHKIVRQSLSNRAAHWMVALSTLILLFSGFGQMPMYKRYGISSLPGLAWAENFHITLTIHYIAGSVLLFAAIYHLVYMVLRREFDILPKLGDFRESVLVIGSMLKVCKAPACHKYLGEQRLAYAFIGANLGIAIATGIVKIVKNMPGAEFSQDILFAATTLHNFAAFMLIVGIVGHLAAFIFKENWALLPAMFTGCVDLGYVRERHPHWYRDLVVEPGKLRESLCASKRNARQEQEVAS